MKNVTEVINEDSASDEEPESSYEYSTFCCQEIEEETIIWLFE